MGAAAQKRGDNKIARDIQEQIAASGRTKDARTMLWRDLLQDGCILHFKANDGTMLTAGPLQFAVPRPSDPTHSVQRFGGRFAFRHDGSAWGAALEIVEHVGRKAPVKVSCPRDGSRR